MNVNRSAYSFRPATTKDLLRLRRWLNTPEVRRWWGDPTEQFELLRADLNEPLMTMRIVSLGERPFAYAQDYDVHSWPQPHLAHLPGGRDRLTASSAGRRWSGAVMDKRT
jgi:aminoglycoside 6'-N-acetyltransferase